MYIEIAKVRTQQPQKQAWFIQEVKNKIGSGKYREHKRRKDTKSKKGREPLRRVSTLLKGLIRR